MVTPSLARLLPVSAVLALVSLAGCNAADPPEAAGQVNSLPAMQTGPVDVGPGGIGPAGAASAVGSGNLANPGVAGPGIYGSGTR